MDGNRKRILERRFSITAEDTPDAVPRRVTGFTWGRKGQLGISGIIRDLYMQVYGDLPAGGRAEDDPVQCRRGGHQIERFQADETDISGDHHPHGALRGGESRFPSRAYGAPPEGDGIGFCRRGLTTPTRSTGTPPE